MAIYNEQVKLTQSQLFNNHHLRRNSFIDYVYGIIRFLGIIVENLYCISSYLVLSWIVFLPLSWFKNELYSKAENYLYNSLLFIVSSWSLAAGAVVVETGDDYKQLIEPKSNNHYKRNLLLNSNNNYNYNNYNHNDNDKNNNNNNGKIYYSTTATASDLVINNNNSKSHLMSAAGDAGLLSAPSSLKCHQAKPRILLLCNHISTADVPLIMQSFSTLTNQSLLWVLDAQFKPTNFGIVCGSHGDFFVAKNAYTEGSLRDQVLKHPDRNVLVLFPEGGFLRKRLEGSNRYAKKNGLPPTEYVSHPRFGAFKDLIDPCVGVTHIVDATLLYNDIKDPLSVLDLALGTRKEPAILNFKVYNRSEIEPTEEWLRNLWLDKDKLMKRFYEDRGSVMKQIENTMRVAHLDWFKLLAVHLFYLLFCYLVIFRLFCATNVTMLKARELYILINKN